MKFIVDEKDINNYFILTDVGLLSSEEAEVLLTDTKRNLHTSWWLSPADNTASGLRVVDESGAIVKAPSVASGWDLGVRPALRFTCSARVNVGDQLVIGKETWMVALVSPVSDSIAVCDRIVGKTKFCSGAVTDYRDSDVRCWILDWAAGRGILPASLQQVLNNLTM